MPALSAPPGNAITFSGARLGHSRAADATQAVDELHAALMPAGAALAQFFCSSHYDLDALGAALNRRFAGIPLIGCTTAGEIGPAGYVDRSLSGVAFGAGDFCISTALFDELQRFQLNGGRDGVQSLLRRHEAPPQQGDASNSFAFLLIDGLSVREERVASALQHHLGSIELVGGSAGDDQRFEHTLVFHGGAFHRDSAVLTLVSTPRSLEVFKIQHFVHSPQRMVITSADPTRRLVYEIDGLPAAAQYARLVGLVTGDFDPHRFADTPVVMLIDGNDYVRSIQRANPDDSLVFYSAVEEGMVLRAAHSLNLVDDLESAFAQVRGRVGTPTVTLCCDCVLRRRQVVHDGLESRVNELFRAQRAIGFNTYGEQFHGVHVNQTLTGVMIGNVETP